MLAADAGLDLLVGDDAALLERGHEHLARLQPALLDDLLRRHVEDTGLRGHDEQVLVGEAVAGRAQAVAVERGSDERAVGEGDAGGAVPGLDDAAVELVEGLAVGGHLRVLLPGLRDEHHHHFGQAAAAEHEQLDHVVEHGRVGRALLRDGHHLVQLIEGEEVRLEQRLTRAHPVDVAAHGVDLAVVGERAVGMRQRPRGQGVGAEAAVDERDGRLEGLVLEVRVVGRHLRGREHALVQQRARRERADVELLGRLGRLAHHARPVLAHDHELALELVLAERGGPADEHLAHDGLRGGGGGPQGLVVGGDLAPAQQLQAHLVEDAPQHQLHGRVAMPFLLEEAHAHRVVAGAGQVDAQRGALAQQEGVWELHQDAGAIAGVGLRPARTAVVEVHEHLDALLDHAVGGDVVEIGHEADTASVVLGRRLVEGALRLWLGHGSILHGCARPRSVRERGTQPPGNPCRRPRTCGWTAKIREHLRLGQTRAPVRGLRFPHRKR